MSSRIFLKRPFLAAAFLAAGLICLSTPARAGLLPSRTEAAGSVSRIELEREIVTADLAELGWSREDAAERVALLTDGEIERLASARMTLESGGDGVDTRRAAGVGLAIAVVLVLFTGIYLFSTAN